MQRLQNICLHDNFTGSLSFSPRHTRHVNSDIVLDIPYAVLISGSLHQRLFYISPFSYLDVDCGNVGQIFDDHAGCIFDDHIGYIFDDHAGYIFDGHAEHFLDGHVLA